MLDAHDLRDRQIRAAVREHDALSQKLYTVVKLDRPIQRGWRRFYVLSEQASRRRDRPFLEAILKVIGTVIVHHSPDFRGRSGRRRKLVEIEQPLRPIPVHEWQRRNYPSEWWRYFHYELLPEYNWHWQPYWVVNQPSLFELKTVRNWLWYFDEVDPVIATRLSELDRWLDGHGGWLRYSWLKGRRQKYRYNDEDLPWHRSLRRVHLREINQALRQFPDVDPAASMRCGQISARFILTIFFPGVAQCRGNELRPRPVRVQVLPPGPFHAS